MSIQQIVNNLVQLDAQVQGWASGQISLPKYEEVARLRLQMVALLYIPLTIDTTEGRRETSLMCCALHKNQIPEAIYEKLELLRSQVTNFDKQLTCLQNRLVRNCAELVLVH